jgi:hypothetical protein
MNNENPLTPLEAIERDKAHLLEQVAELELLAKLAAKHNYDLIPRDSSGQKPSEAAPVEYTVTPKPQAQIISPTIGEVIARYQADPKSPYNTNIAHATRTNYASRLRRLIRDIGDMRAPDIKASDIEEWYEKWKDGNHPYNAHALITILRQVVHYGAREMQDRSCFELQVVMHNLRFQGGGSRNERLTALHVVNIRAAAHRARVPSIALAQAFQFECRLKQKDVIGEWVPSTEPVQAFIENGEKKWIRGLRWEEIDESLNLRHMTGHRQGSAVINLRQCPMIMEELARYLGTKPGTKFARAELPLDGAVVICERSGFPWIAVSFREVWREIADAAGVPPEVRNMDSRARAKANGHAKIETDEAEASSVWN